MRKLADVLGCGWSDSAFVSQALSVKVTPGKATPDNRQRLEQEEEAEEKRLAIMMMKKKDKYLYDKIMFGKKRKVREVRRLDELEVTTVITQFVSGVNGWRIGACRILSDS